jgi:hypothetical protein
MSLRIYRKCAPGGNIRLSVQFADLLGVQRTPKAPAESYWCRVVPAIKGRFIGRVHLYYAP